MADTHSVSGAAPGVEPLSPQQIAYFGAFGFLRLPGLFRHEIERITTAFEEVFASEVERDESIQRVHGHEPRVIVSNVTDHHDVLARLPRDPRVLAVIRSLMGESHEYAGSDGNLYYCDTYWHSDIFGSPLDQFHVKFSMYLDAVDEDSGAIRVIPGSHFINEGFSRALRRGFRDPTQVDATFGVLAPDIPAVAIASEPGDVIAWNYRIVHASFNGAPRRRHLSFGFRETRPDDARQPAKGRPPRDKR